ncbi:MAG: flagellar motor switch phosphatase FliY [Lachnospiraceae bacterium]|nr:flagellar motor switch phosphatase FliY [Lachnospiraceae bacterium]
MDGMLSQDEINALLNGMDATGETEAASDGGGDAGGSFGNEELSDVEKDAIGEVANISMGSSATTLYSLLNLKVNITTPKVELATWKNVLEDYARPCVFTVIKYTVGLDGSNILILKEHDVLVITDLMMGNDGTNVENKELGDLELSAISEAMNQMMGAAATSLSTMLGEKIDISPPQSTLLDLTEQDPAEISPFLAGTFVKITFRMQIGDLIDSALMQLYPIDFARTLYDTFLSQAEEPAPAPAPAPSAPPPDMSVQTSPPPQMSMPQAPQMQTPQMQTPQMQMPQMQMPQMQMPQMQMPQMQMPMGMPMSMPMQAPQDYQTAQFQSFPADMSNIPGAENISLIQDVPLDVTVELGRTKRPISDILDFAPGTIVELDKIAGEPVDVLVNGKLVAKGEVVVIEESFGVRVTEIVK